MTTHTIKQDRTTQWKINNTNDTWNLNSNAQLFVTGKTAITVGNGFENNTINIYGDILNTGVDSNGVEMMGDGNTIRFAASAEIKAAMGVYGDGLDTTIVNKGDIDAGYYGINMENGAHVVNSGDITGMAGIVFGTTSQQSTSTDASSIVNQHGGKIIGGLAGLYLLDAGKHTVVNDGLIAGSSFAVVGGGGTTHLTNTGRIDGNIQFGYGNDTVDTRKGQIFGDIFGGGGDDTYLVGKLHGKIYEGGGNGYDVVKSTTSHTLGDNIERLQLLGAGNTNGYGNMMDNTIDGNSGNNKLSGSGGDDWLSGGKGTDALTGGVGSDMFFFRNGDGIDTVKDFENGADHIALRSFTGDDNFTDVSSHISTHGADLWITYGSDKLVLHDTKLADMDASDFSFQI
jgi:Ca2+-binding RTX toxin-like protein